MPESPSLIAVDIGNSRIKFGRFDQPAECIDAALGRALPIAGAALPEPQSTLTVSPPMGPRSQAAEELKQWLADEATGSAAVAIAAVHRGVEAELLETLATVEAIGVTRLSNDALPIEVRVDQPERVGIDRLLAAVAANRFRRADRAAIVVDLGSAITVDLVVADGAFEGGAILPGIGMSARALHEQTDALPVSGLQELGASPDAVGKSTGAAIEAGLFWGAVGAIRELIARQSDRLTQSPQVFLTGGAAPSVARLLGGPELTVRYLPNLVLSGIAVAIESAGRPA
ncbi:MAG: type III pantothenate kinase [Planctomycetota bacterium]